MTTLNVEAPALVKPTAKEIDALCVRYKAAERETDEADAALKAKKESQAKLKAHLIEMVRQFGARHTEKSERLTGVHGKATVTVGTRTVVRPDRVEGLRQYLGEQEIPGLAGKFFREHVTYTMVEGPTRVLETLDLKSRIRAKIESLLGLCFGIETNSPSLKVEVTEAEKP